MVKETTGGRRWIWDAVPILSVFIAGLSLWVANASFTLSRAANESAYLLYLTGRPLEDGAALQLRASSADVMFRFIRIKLEHEKGRETVSLPLGSDILSREDLLPHLSQRLERFIELPDVAKAIDSLEVGGTAQFFDQMPIVTRVGYVVRGRTLEDVSVYSLDYTLTLVKGETVPPAIRLNGLAFCNRVPDEERDSWFEDESIFVGVGGLAGAGGGGFQGPASVRFVNCAI